MPPGGPALRWDAFACSLAKPSEQSRARNTARTYLCNALLISSDSIPTYSAVHANGRIGRFTY
jgi:hypothetical protein